MNLLLEIILASAYNKKENFMANMLITDQSLTKISKKLLDKRVLDTSKYTVIGNPLFTETSVSLFSAADFIRSNSFNLTSTSLEIICSGTYQPSESITRQSLWSLTSSTSFGNDTISLVFEDGYIKLFRGNTNIRTLIKFNFSEDSSFQIRLTLTSDSYNITVINNKSRQTLGGIFTGINFNSYHFLSLGSVLNGNMSWLGSINLAQVQINKNNVLFYTFSKEITFNFSKILVSDGTIELTDSTIPVLNHVYGFDIIELNRTSNTILLKATIDSGTHLTLNQIGLYVETEDNEQLLFSVTKGYSLKKGSNLGYELIFNINLELDVVNTIGFPEIIVKESPYATSKEFNEIKQVYLYLLTNLERAIKLNSTELGYARELKLNNVQTNLDLSIDNYHAVLTYIQLKYNTYTNSNVEVKDFYSTFNYPYSLYYIKNLSNLPSSDIQIYENELKGQKDSIDFGLDIGFSLVTKLNLTNLSKNYKYILGKVNFNSPTAEKYFTLYYSNYTLTFKLYLEDDVVTLNAVYDDTTISDIVSAPVMVSVVCRYYNNQRIFYFYINDSMVKTYTTSSVSFLDPSLFTLANYIPQENSSPDLLVEKIVSFKGTLSHNDIRYLKSALISVF